MQPQTFSNEEVQHLKQMQRKLILENKIKGGINWFYWIAGLSVINTLIYKMGSALTFVLGLGATQITDGIASVLIKDHPTNALIFGVTNLVIDLILAGIFVLFGVLGRKRVRWAIILGMVSYAVDLVLVLISADYFGAAFHLLALWGLWNGLKAIRDLAAFEKATTIAVLPADGVQTLVPEVQPAIEPVRSSSDTFLKVLAIVMSALDFLYYLLIFVLLLLSKS
ncbi:MAG: hypothetical protein ABSA51_04895 [Anaerolineaceae bacterium]|jgi:hypothetical protein